MECQTCLSSKSVEKRLVTPLMRLEKENDPPPYLWEKIKTSQEILKEAKWL